MKYWPLGLLLVARGAFVESQDATTLSEVKLIVVTQTKAVKVRSPQARLFQVLVSNLVAEPKRRDQGGPLEIHSFFEVSPGQTYAEVVDRLGDPSQTQILVRAFRGNDCFYGYPVGRSKTCAPTVEPPSTESHYLSLDWNLDSAKLAAIMEDHNLDPSKGIDITIVSAGRATIGWKSLQKGTLSEREIYMRLAGEKATDAVFAITERPGMRTEARPTLVLRGSDQTYLGDLPAAKHKKLPPTR